MLIRLLLSIFFLQFLVSCQTSTKSSSKELSKEIFLEFNPKKNRKEHFKYLSESRTKTLEEGNLRHQRDQIVDFELVQIAKSVDSKSKTFTFLETTVKKDGLVPLEVFGLPDIGEAFERVYDRRGKILSAGDFPKDSFYMVPYMVFPEEKVKPGSQWKYETQWKMGTTSFTLDAQFKLEKIYNCKDSHECAEVIIEANVIPQLKDKSAKYGVKHNGRVLFDLTRSSVLWGSFRSSETINSKKLNQTVESCVGFKLIVPEDQSIDKKIKCDVL